MPGWSLRGPAGYFGMLRRQADLFRCGQYQRRAFSSLGRPDGRTDGCSMYSVNTAEDVASRLHRQEAGSSLNR